MDWYAHLAPRPALCGDEKAAFAHDLFGDVGCAVFGFEPDVEAEADDVDVRAGAPGGAGMLAVWIAEGDVDSGELLVLEDVADDALNAEVGADGKLAYAVGVFIGMRVGPEILFKLLIGAGATDNAIGGDLDGERRGGEETVARAEPVAHDAVDDKGAVD